MARIQLTYTITLTALPSTYVATVTAWGVPDVGSYGSLWTRTLELEGTSALSDASSVLSALARALRVQLGEL